MSFQEELEKLVQEIYFTGFQVGQYTQPSDETLEKRLNDSLTSIINLVDKEREKQLEKTLEIMKDTMAENFHYRIMCGEIKDPEGKIDVHKAFIDYQELEPERKKFTDYLEEMRAKLKGVSNG